MVARDFIPARNALNGGRRAVVDIEQHLAVHVLAHGQAEEVQHGGA